MVPLRAVSVFSLIVVLVSCGGSSGGSAPGPTGPGPGPGGPSAVTVTVSNNSYSPDPVTVNLGTTVNWRWNACTGDPYGGQQNCVAHSVTFDDGGPSASARGEGAFSRTFSTAGTYTYYCTAHGRAAMSGSVVAR